MSSGNGQSSGSQAGPNLSFSPRAVEQNGQLQRQLQSQPALQSGPPSFDGRALSQIGQFVAQNPQAVQALATPGAGNGYGPPIMGADPNFAATMQQLEGLMGKSKENKQAIARVFMGG